MEPKAKTLQERFGFSDPDLKTPKHDAIMMWLDRGIERVLANEFKPAWVLDWTVDSGIINRSLLEQLMIDMRQQILCSLNLSEYPRRTICKKNWESPILDRTYTIGFADMLVQWRDESVLCSFSSGLRVEDVKYRCSGLSSRDYKAYFEVKPAIPSVGELIRQLRMYQTYTQDAKWFVVSPDARFRSVIEDQGFGFVLVPESVGQL